MSNIYLAAKNNPKVANGIKEALEHILKLDEEAVSLYCPRVFNKLARVHKEELFEKLSEKDFLDITKELKKALPRISEDTEKAQKKLEVLEQNNLDDEEIRIRERMEANSARIRSIQAHIKTPMPEQPGVWSRFIADKNPGLLKSFFLFFVPKTSIESAKNACNHYDNEAIQRWKSVVEMKALKSEEKKLNHNCKVLEQQIEKRDQLQQSVQELSEGQRILQQATQQLEENLDKLVPKADAAQVEQLFDVEEELSEDDLQFLMEL